MVYGILPALLLCLQDLNPSRLWGYVLDGKTHRDGTHGIYGMKRYPISSPRPEKLVDRGGYDGKVKLFNAQSGLCFVTFAEHTAAVQGICFTPQGWP